MNGTNKFTGLNSISISVSNNVMTCKFTRENKDRDPLYLNMNTQKLFMKISYGNLVGDGKIKVISFMSNNLNIKKIKLLRWQFPNILQQLL